MPKRKTDSIEKHAEDLKEVAHKHYVEEMELKQIAPDLGISVSATSGLLKEARKKQIVSFDVDSSFGIVGDEVERLSNSLRTTFLLESARVVKIELESADTSTNSDGLLRRDDNLHIALANLMGKKVKNRIQPDEHIGVAGGRAVYHAVKVIRRSPPVVSNIKITPLSGRIWTHSWQAQGPYISRPLDADDSAFALALAFENQPGTSFRQVGVRLFASDKSRARDAIKENCLFLPDGSWPDGELPDRALVGIGVVDSNTGHRFADLSRDEQQLAKMDRYLRGAADGLKIALSLVEKNGLPAFGDTVYRLFPTLPLPEQLDPMTDLALLDRAYGELGRALDKLNERMVVITWDHLRRIRSVIAIAGGPLKLNVIWTLLLSGYCDPSRRIISELCTDAESAARLIAALNKFENAPSHIRSWYERKAKEIFEKS